MSIASEWAEYASELSYEDLSEEVVDHAKTLLLDHLGVAFGGGHYSPSASALIEGVRELDDADASRGEATVVATGEKMTVGNAALLNGSLSHSLDFDDTEIGHPGSSIIPASLAAAEAEDATGRELLTGIVAGYEVYCRLVRAINARLPTGEDVRTHYDRGFDAAATCGVFGATAAAGSIRGHDADTIEDAFGLNASQASGTHGYIRYEGWNKRAHLGLAAQSATTATSLAGAGFKGISKPVEGYRNFFHAYAVDPTPEEATADLGTEYILPKTGIKPYPCCRGMHTVIDLALDIANERDVGVEEVESVAVEVPSSTVDHLGRPREVKCDPTYLSEAQFSIPFAVSLAVLRKEAGLHAFLDEMEGGYGEDVDRLIDRVSVSSREDLDEMALEGKRPATVTVVTESDEYQRSAEQARGDYEKPHPQSRIERKFENLTEELDDSAAVIDRVDALEDYTVEELLEPFRK